MVAEIDDENAARIQPRTAIAVKLRRTELRGLPVPVEAIDKQDVAAPFVPSYEFGAVIADDLEAIAFGRQEELLANGNDLGIDLDRRNHCVGQKVRRASGRARVWQYVYI